MDLLTEIEKSTIYAALQNGLGLTNPCRGLNKSIIEVSTYIKSDPAFEMECRARITAGYQLIIMAINNAASKAAWAKWNNHRSAIDNFVISLNLWESICTEKTFDFKNCVIAIRQCKTIPETATAVGMDESELWNRIYSQPGLAQWLLQNGYQI